MVGYTDPEGVANAYAARTEMITSRMDEIISIEAKTTAMTPDPALVEAAGKAGEIKLATISTGGLGTYSRQYGYPQIPSELEWNSYKLTHDRGCKLDVDRRDQDESGGLASIGALAATLTRTQIIPEIDSTRLSTIYSLMNADITGVKATNLVSATLSATDVLTAIETGIDQVAEGWNADSGYTIYANSKLKSVLRSSKEYTKTRDVSGSRILDSTVTEINGCNLVWVPSARMKTAYTYNDGITSGQQTGGIVADAGAQDINFVIVAPGVAQGVVAVNAEKYITKETNQLKDADALYLRIYHDLIMQKQKYAGAYVHVAPIARSAASQEATGTSTGTGDAGIATASLTSTSGTTTTKSTRRKTTTG